MDLKLNIGTYCGLLWALFGDHCDYYCELLKIYHILDWEECSPYVPSTQKRCARKLHGQSLMMDGPSLDATQLRRILPLAPPSSFGTTFQFSTSYLESIMDSVQNAIPIQ
jgi:hypothetical protein